MKNIFIILWTLFILISCSNNQKDNNLEIITDNKQIKNDYWNLWLESFKKVEPIPVENVNELFWTGTN